MQISHTDKLQHNKKKEGETTERVSSGPPARLGHVLFQGELPSAAIIENEVFATV